MSVLKVTIRLALSVICITTACASTFRSSVQLARRGANAVNVLSSGFKDNNQQVMSDVSSLNFLPGTQQNSQRRQGHMVGNIEYVAYTTYFGIGTSPAQLMHAYIDLNCSDLIIPAVNCTACDGINRYDHTKSPTYEENGTAITVEPAFQNWGKGVVSLDTVTLAEGIEIPHHPFVEAERSDSLVWAPDDVDTTLGLSMGGPVINTSETKHFLPSILETMVKEKVLDHNVFSLLLPQRDGDQGDLMFGAYDEALYEGDFSIHPLYPENSTQWAVEAISASVAYSNGTFAGNQSLAGYRAVLTTTYPWITLPPYIANTLVNAIGADCTDSCTGCEVPCDQVDQLPELTLNLGGHDITIGPWDYTAKTDIQWPFCFDYKVYCTLLIDPEEQILGNKEIWLGPPFLKSVYSVFDVDNRAVRFAKAKRS